MQRMAPGTMSQNISKLILSRSVSRGSSLQISGLPGGQENAGSMHPIQLMFMTASATAAETSRLQRARRLRLYMILMIQILILL